MHTNEVNTGELIAEFIFSLVTEALCRLNP